MTGRYKLEPQAGQNLWDEERHQVHKKHPNGTITRVDWHDKEVTVTFTDGGMEFYDFDTLYGNWHGEKFGGTWMLHHEGK